MKPMMILLKREWLEWNRVIIGTILVVTFLNLLMLLSVARGSDWFHEKLEREGHINMENVQFNNEEVGDIDIRMNGDEIEVYIDGSTSMDNFNKVLNQAAKPVVIGLRIGMQLTFGFVLFLSLFYFSDSIYKERADSSTLFYRSLPISDHQILLSKVLAGLIGVMGLTLFLSLEYLVFMRVAIMIMGEPVNAMATAVLAKISYISLMWDWFSYLIFAAIRMGPLALFLMLVGTYVKGRPLLVGIGGPILLAISYSIIFRSGALFRSIGNFLWGFNQKLIEQWDMSTSGMTEGPIVYGNFWGYIFNLETLVALVVSGLLYFALWMTYKKNIPVG